MCRSESTDADKVRTAEITTVIVQDQKRQVEGQMGKYLRRMAWLAATYNCYHASSAFSVPSLDPGLAAVDPKEATGSRGDGFILAPL
jgi:hypothetical protein